jgi:hypothetical protein
MLGYLDNKVTLAGVQSGQGRSPLRLRRIGAITMKKSPYRIKQDTAIKKAVGKYERERK